MTPSILDKLELISANGREGGDTLLCSEQEKTSAGASDC